MNGLARLRLRKDRWACVLRSFHSENSLWYMYLLFASDAKTLRTLETFKLQLRGTRPHRTLTDPT